MKYTHKGDGNTADTNVLLGVLGMSCKNCVNSIKNAVSKLNGVKKVGVDLDSKKVSVEFDDERVSIDTIKDVIEDQGYQAR